MAHFRYVAIIAMLTLISVTVWAADTGTEVIAFDDGWGSPGFTVTRSGDDGIDLVFSLPSISLTPAVVDGEAFTGVSIPGAILPTNAGEPNLPGMGRFVALPVGARMTVEILDSRTRTLEGINVLPAARLPLDTEDKAPLPEKNPAIYQRNAVWPRRPVEVSGPMTLRGVDARILGITPFGYNPVTRELTVYTDFRIRLRFTGGEGVFGDDRLRSRYWDPILERQLLNFDRLAPVDYPGRDLSGRDGVEYIIIVPDDADFISWGQTVADFRKLQGISSQVFTVTDVGGNTPEAIEAFIDDAYNTWSTAPVAVLFLGDYVDSGQAGGVTSPLNGYYISDNLYADVDGDHLPDLVTARITARDDGELSVMIGKFLDYEQNPPTAANFYDNPLVACGFQTERWFQICTEIVRGFWVNELGKSPVRQYNVYSGSPAEGDPWSSNSNTYMLVDYFGTAGLNYIPDTQPDIDWDSGSAAGINAAINAGCFILQHRDHGGEDGWGEPDYHNTDLAGLSNTMLPWVFSINCLTGKFDEPTEVFAEAFHRMEGGALGITAATESSYSFVNDTYVFGMYDSMWPDFDPGYPAGGIAAGLDDMRPAFANVSGKYFLEASSWPYNPDYKEITYYLFHSHSDAFVTLYSEVPSTMSVTHDAALLSMIPVFSVTAPAGSVIALTRDGEILGVADGTGAPVNITIPGQLPGSPPVVVTVTKANYYRYEADVEVIPQSGPYVSYAAHVLDDDNSGSSSGNGDGIATPGEVVEIGLTLRNYGLDPAYGVTATVTSASPYVTMLDDTADFGDFAADESKTNDADALVFEVLNTCPHGASIQFDVSVTDGSEVWDSAFFITVEAAQMQLYGHVVADYPLGNDDGDADMGETVYVDVTLENIGAVDTSNVSATITPVDPTYVTVLDGAALFPDIPSGGTGASLSPYFRFTIDISAPCGTMLAFDLDVTTDQGSASDLLNIQVGGTAVIFEDDMEAGVGDWTHTSALGTDTWSWLEDANAHSPTHSWHAVASGELSDQYLYTPDVALTELSELTFWHTLDVEDYWDGCVIEISTDGGSSWEDLKDQITQNPYNGTLYTGYSNPLEGRETWTTGSVGTMTEVRADLGPYAGTTAVIRFRIATDDYTYEYPGWYIDDVTITGADCQPYSGPVDTVAANLTCVPDSGTVPFTSQFTVQLTNLTAGLRSAAARIDVQLAGGSAFSNWRAGWTNLGAGETYQVYWNQYIPAQMAMIGQSIFQATVEDVTPVPYNQPPYPASGDTDTSACTVTGYMP